MARKDPMIFQSIVMLSNENIEMYRKKIKKQLIEGVVLLPCYIQLVTPQEPKTGHWIEKDGFDGDTYYDCSECGEAFCLIDGTPTDNLYNYCPNCGAKMEGEDNARKDTCKDE